MNDDNRIKKELESQKENLERAGRIKRYLVISELSWIAFSIYFAVAQDIYFAGQTIIGCLAIGFFWLFVQQKMISNIYLSILNSYLGIIKKDSDQQHKEVMDQLSKESTEVMDSSDIPNIKDLSKAKTDEELT